MAWCSIHTRRQELEVGLWQLPLRRIWASPSCGSPDSPPIPPSKRCVPEGGTQPASGLCLGPLGKLLPSGPARCRGPRASPGGNLQGEDEDRELTVAPPEIKNVKEIREKARKMLKIMRKIKKKRIF